MDRQESVSDHAWRIARDSSLRSSGTVSMRRRWVVDTMRRVGEAVGAQKRQRASPHATRNGAVGEIAASEAKESTG